MKMVCENCNWKGLAFERLSAPSPFDAHDTLYACPSCKTVGEMRGACDHPNCWDRIDAGTPTPVGYRKTCSKHVPGKKPLDPKQEIPKRTN